jgi:hypothetical protein
MMIGIMPNGEAAGGIVGFLAVAACQVVSGLNVFSSAWYNNNRWTNIQHTRVTSAEWLRI